MKLTPEELAWGEIIEKREREEVRSNLANYGELTHPDDPPRRSLYLRAKYFGTGLSSFLRKIDGEPEPKRPDLFQDDDDKREAE